MYLVTVNLDNQHNMLVLISLISFNPITYFTDLLRRIRNVENGAGDYEYFRRFIKIIES